MKKTILVIICVLVAACSASTPQKQDPQLVRLFTLINERLSYMEDVAAWKWINRKPIEDLEREKAVLVATSNAAGQYGLDGASITPFAEAQMDAAKAVQVRVMDQ